MIILNVHEDSLDGLSRRSWSVMIDGFGTVSRFQVIRFWASTRRSKRHTWRQERAWTPPRRKGDFPHRQNPSDALELPEGGLEALRALVLASLPELTICKER